jgi:hypothetical protein
MVGFIASLGVAVQDGFVVGGLNGLPEEFVVAPGTSRLGGLAGDLLEQLKWSRLATAAGAYIAKPPPLDANMLPDLGCPKSENGDRRRGYGNLIDTETVDGITLARYRMGFISSNDIRCVYFTSTSTIEPICCSVVDSDIEKPSRPQYFLMTLSVRVGTFLWGHDN